MLHLDDLRTYSMLVRVCARYGVDPTGSSESREFFKKLLSEYEGSANLRSVASWLKEQIPKHFVALRYRPKWIQGPEWPYANGQPMMFAGQIDINQREREKVEPPLYHDDTSLYVFVERAMEPVVIIQQY
jgi:hypothetical protein